MNNIGSITLAFVNNVSINLGCFHVGMSKHSFNGIDVGIMFKLQGSKGVAGTMVIQPEISGRQMKAVRDIKR